MPKSKHEGGFACPICKYKVSFVLSVATVRSELWRQPFEHEFKFDERNQKKFHFVIPLFCSCPQCGEPMAPPAELLKAYHKRSAASRQANKTSRLR
jgi:hypothetical protein